MHSIYPAAPADDTVQWNLGPVIQALRSSREDKHKIRHNGRVRELPSREALTTIVKACRRPCSPRITGART